MNVLREFTIRRVSSYHHGTFGALLDGPLPFALTVEPPWKDNEPNISCIPEGVYICESVNSVHFGSTFEVMDVPDRTLIRFHGGNLGVGDEKRAIDPDTKGCPVIGEEFGFLYGLPAVLSSQRGFREFKQRTAELNRFRLKIENFPEKTT